MKWLTDYCEQNHQTILNDVMTCVRFKSISSDPSCKKDILACANWFLQKFKAMGLDEAELHDSTGNPMVYAQWLKAGKDKPTILLYGHYDVMPVDPVEQWKTPPFEPAIREGRMFGRGTSDDKAQFLTQIFAVEALLKQTGELPVNIKILVEGDEETKGEAAISFVKERASLLSCDVVLDTDSNWVSSSYPSIIYSYRGLVALEATFKGPHRDLHSGFYGGTVVNPVNAMVRVMGKLLDDQGRIAIPGFYDDVLPLSLDEKKSFALVEQEDSERAKELNVSVLGGEIGFTTNERNWARPSLDMNGVWGGYAGAGNKTIIPSECGFKMSLRIVANQTCERCRRLFEDFIREQTPEGVTVKVIDNLDSETFFTSPKNPYLSHGQRALEQAFGLPAVLVRNGASLPIASVLQHSLNVPVVLMCLGLAEDNTHAPNESFRLDHLFKGIEAGVVFLNLCATS